LSPRSKTNNQLLIKTAGIYFAVVMLVGLCIELTGSLLRAELQWINHRYETRPWIFWTKESLDKLNPATLWNYHESHEIPRHWWAWDYTLSWLIEKNHPPVKEHIVIFNRLLEDEPPLEAIEDHPWMAPLTRQPMSRGTVAEMVRFLAKAGVKQIILDNDFPGYTAEDEKLASVIYRCTSGELTGKKIPVLMARTISRRSAGQLLQLHQEPSMSGVLRELQKFDPDASVVDKYTGTTASVVDYDLVIRRMAATLPSPESEDTESLILKSLKLQGLQVSDVPAIFDIDFSAPPNSDLYPVRPIHYLLDPKTRAELLNPAKDSTDVRLKDAVVIIGDGDTDLVSTPHTNLGVNLMSGSELLAHGMDTVARQSWHRRLYRLDSFPYLFAISLVATALHFALRSGLQRVFSPVVLTSPLGRFSPDAIAFGGTVALVYLISCILFAHWLLIVPLVPVIAAITIATLSATLYEREEERTAHMKQQMESAREKFESDLKLQQSEARNREAQRDKERKREFARRINHDLKAPVSVLNWTLARLRQDGIAAKGAPEKIERLERTTDRLFRLIGELVRTYDDVEKRSLLTGEVCDLRELIFGSIDVQSALAEMQRSRIHLDVPDDPMRACVSATDFARIIDNLMRNALIHNPPGTTLSVAARTENGEHIVSVSDNGKGIPADKLPSLFEPGVRGETEDKTGSGLGLSIVKQLVESSAAQIFVDSKVGSGTTFILHCQQSPDEPAAQDMKRGLVLPFVPVSARPAAAAPSPVEAAPAPGEPAPASEPVQTLSAQPPPEVPSTIPPSSPEPAEAAPPAAPAPALSPQSAAPQPTSPTAQRAEIMQPEAAPTVQGAMPIYQEMPEQPAAPVLQAALDPIAQPEPASQATVPSPTPPEPMAEPAVIQPAVAAPSSMWTGTGGTDLMTSEPTVEISRSNITRAAIEAESNGEQQQPTGVNNGAESETAAEAITAAEPETTQEAESKDDGDEPPSDAGGDEDIDMETSEETSGSDEEEKPATTAASTPVIMGTSLKGSLLPSKKRKASLA
jgi:signal transduction histidine kinase